MYQFPVLLRLWMMSMCGDTKDWFPLVVMKAFKFLKNLAERKLSFISIGILSISIFWNKSSIDMVSEFIINRILSAPLFITSIAFELASVTSNTSMDWHIFH